MEVEDSYKINTMITYKKNLIILVLNPLL